MCAGYNLKEKHDPVIIRVATHLRCTEKQTTTKTQQITKAIYSFISKKYFIGLYLKFSPGALILSAFPYLLRNCVLHRFS